MVIASKNTVHSVFFLILDFIPNLLIALIELITSSDINKFSALEIPLANEDNKTKRIKIKTNKKTRRNYK